MQWSCPANSVLEHCGLYVFPLGGGGCGGVRRNEEEKKGASFGMVNAETTQIYFPRLLYMSISFYPQGYL